MYKIVIIDDEPMIIKGLTTLVPWFEIGCEVVGIAENGLDGLAKVKELQPDIVISDIQMPKLSGLEMIRSITQARINVKCILLTGYRQFEYAKEAIDLGVLKYLLKPTNLEEIKAAVVEMTQLIDEEQSREESINQLKQRLQELENNQEDSEGPLSDGPLSEGNPFESSVNNETSEANHSTKFLVRKAIAFMKENYMLKLDLQSVADHLYISTWYVCKLFKQELDSSFIELLNEIRIQEAKRLLTESNLKIYEICEAVGYNDNPYFTKTFKKYAGMTPNHYRNSQGIDI